MSGNHSRRKGMTAEVAVVNWLRTHGWPDARRYLAGDGRQPGDIDGVPGVCLDVKNRKEFDLPAWMRQTVTEAGPNLPVVVVKPRLITDVSDWLAVTRMTDFAQLLHDSEWCPHCDREAL